MLCLDTEAVSMSDRFRLVRRVALFIALLLIVGVAGVLLRAHALGRLSQAVAITVVVLPTTLLACLVYLRTSMRRRGQIARFQLVGDDRERLAIVLPTARAAKQGRSESWFSLRCHDGEPVLDHRSGSIRLKPLGVRPTVLISRAGKIVGVDLSRGSDSVRVRAVGAGR